PRARARIMPRTSALDRVVEGAQRLLLLLVEIHGGLDLYAAVEVAVAARAHRAHALAAQPEHAARLRLGRNLEHDVAVERRHLDRAAEHGRREADRHLAAQVLAVAGEDRMVFDD